MKVYLVFKSDNYNSHCIGVFKDNEKAEKYAQLQTELDYMDEFCYVVTHELLDNTVKMDDKVVEYYSFYVGPMEDIEEGETIETTWINDPEDKTKRIYDSDLSVVYEKDSFTVYSLKSFDEAKNVALGIIEENKKV